MKTLFRLGGIVAVLALIGVGLYSVFQIPLVQSRLSFELGEADGNFPPGAGDERFFAGNGQGRGFGAELEGEAEFGRGARWGEGRGELGVGFLSIIAWLSLLGTLLRLVIPMAIVIGVVKLVRWIENKAKPKRKIEVENAHS